MQEKDTETLSNHPERFFDELQPSKVITYGEIQANIRYLEKIKDSAYQKEMFLNLSDYCRNMLSSELRLLRNEFYARKGYIFKSKDLNNYFLRKKWYNPIDSVIDNIPLDKVEYLVIDTIQYYEKNNRELTEKTLKNKFLHSVEDGARTANYFHGCTEIFTSIPLFRRFIGYLIANKDNITDFENFMYVDAYPFVLLIDTIGQKKDILVMAFTRMSDCPAEYCIFSGVVFTCDVKFTCVFDSREIVLESLRKKKKNNSQLYIFEKAYEREKNDSILVTPEGKFSDIEEEK